MSIKLFSPLGVHRLTLAPCKQSKSYPKAPGTPETSPEGPAYATQSARDMYLSGKRLQIDSLGYPARSVATPFLSG